MTLSMYQASANAYDQADHQPFARQSMGQGEQLGTGRIRRPAPGAGP